MRIFDPPFPFDINVFQVYFIIFGVILSNNILMVAAASANSNMFYLPSATRPQLGDVGSAAGHRNLTYLIFVDETELSSSQLALSSFLSSQSAQNYSHHVSFLSKDLTTLMWKYAKVGKIVGNHNQEKHILAVDQLSCQLVSIKHSQYNISMQNLI